MMPCLKTRIGLSDVLLFLAPASGTVRTAAVPGGGQLSRRIRFGRREVRLRRSYGVQFVHEYLKRHVKQTND